MVGCLLWTPASSPELPLLHQPFLFFSQVDIMQMCVIQFDNRPNKPLYHLEHFIEGKYIKYNSNSGFVDDSHRFTPQVRHPSHPALSFPSRPYEATTNPSVSFLLISLRHIRHPFFASCSLLWCVYVYKILTSPVRVHHCTDW